jgi:hypothetical protein
MTSRPRCRLVASRFAGSPAHLEQLLQLLGAPEGYWKAQTPIGFNPIASFEQNPEGTAFSNLVLTDKVTQREIETLLVVMTARMPGLSMEFRIEESENGLVGLRLVLGKLEAGRLGPDGQVVWARIPHHSSLIGSK